MKVLFVTPPYHCGVVEVAGRWIPLQYVYLAASVRAAGHEAVIYDAMSKWHDHKQIQARILAEQPDVVCMSVITATYLDGIEVLSNAKRLVPKVRTVLGGVHAHFMYDEVLRDYHSVVDIIIRGEGELSLVQAIKAFETDGDLGHVSNCAYWNAEKGEAATTQLNQWIQDIDSLPTAFDLIDWPDYKYFVIKNSRLGAVSTSRGCPYGCSFCSQQKFWKRSWRGRDPKKVVEELAMLKAKFGVNVALLTDEYPTADADRWAEFIDRMIHADMGMYMLMETRVEDILRDQALLPKFRKAGIVHVYLGVEATDQPTLDLMKKNSKVESSAEALRLITSHGMVTETSFVLGLPDETPESIERTLELSIHFNPDNAHYLAITPWPYADMYKDLEPYVRDRNYRNYNLIEPVVEPKGMTISELNKAMVECYRRFYMHKMKDFIKEPDPFRRHYLLAAAGLIMKSSFIRQKIKGGIVMPPDMRRRMKQAAQEMKMDGMGTISLEALESLSDSPSKAAASKCPIDHTSRT